MPLGVINFPVYHVSKCLPWTLYKIVKKQKHARIPANNTNIFDMDPKPIASKRPLWPLNTLSFFTELRLMQANPTTGFCHDNMSMLYGNHRPSLKHPLQAFTIDHYHVVIDTSNICDKTLADIQSLERTSSHTTKPMIVCTDRASGTYSMAELGITLHAIAPQILVSSSIDTNEASAVPAVTP